MSIKSLFRQRSDSISDLQEKYKSIEAKKTDLEKRADDLRAESLKSDTDVSEQIKEISEEISLSDIALKETKKALEAMLTQKIQSDFEKLPEQRLDFETKQADLTKQAGRQLGQAIATLQATRLSFATTLERFIREQVVEFSNDHRRSGQMTEFLKTYSSEINKQSDTIDLRSWKKELMRVEQLQPGSLESKRHVAARVKSLISA